MTYIISAKHFFTQLWWCRVNNNDILMRTEAPHPVSARYMGFGKKLVANLDKLLRHFVVWFDYQIMKNFSTKMFLKSFYFKLIKSQTTQRLIIESMTKISCQFWKNMTSSRKKCLPYPFSFVQILYYDCFLDPFLL